MILLIDNYDSFTYNLFQILSVFDEEVAICRNDRVSMKDIKSINPDAFVLSPGPGRPENAGICMDIVSRFYDKIPILGVCLGHQAICTAFGGEISYAGRLMHGKSSIVEHDGDKIFKGVGETFKAGRYHSLTLIEDSLPDDLKVIAVSRDDGEIMAVKHRDFDVYGLQFHPESILTPCGEKIIENFMEGVE